MSFVFFPKVSRPISHIKRLNAAEHYVAEYLHAISGLEDKLGMVFLQVMENFGPKNMDRVERFVSSWPRHVPLAIEFRHKDWYNDPVVAEPLYTLLQEHGIANIITDTAGRRDLLYMRLTDSTAFIRYVGANHESDYARLDDWVERLSEWTNQGLKRVYFFIHQNVEKESPLLSAYFIERLNPALGSNLHIPQLA